MGDQAYEGFRKDIAEHGLSTPLEITAKLRRAKVWAKVLVSAWQPKLGDRRTCVDVFTPGLVFGDESRARVSGCSRC